MKNVTALIAALEAEVGADAVLTAQSDLAPFTEDWRGRYKGPAAAVVQPSNTAQVAAVVRLCATYGVPVLPQGGNTSLCAGAVPANEGLPPVIVNLTRMRRIHHIDAANDSMEVEAGCVLKTVQDAAAAEQRLYAVSLGAEGSCQIGGNLATNAGGLNVLRFGMARDLALGIEAVLPDGRVIQHLRSLRKDNTGYDLRGLLIGSEGTLGIITAATLKLWPQLSSTATALAAVPNATAAVSLLARLRALAAERLNSYELLPRAALDLVIRHIEAVADPLGARHDWYVLCELSSFAVEPLDALLEQVLGDALAAGEVLDAALAPSERARTNLWRLRENIPEAQRRAGPSLKHDISVPVARLPEFIAQASAWVQEQVPEGTLIAYGHAGDGNLHFNISFLKGTAAALIAAQEPLIRRAIHDLVAAHGGSFSAEHGIGRLKVGELERYASPAELATMREIKRALDPNGIMNPGKVLAAG